MKSEELKAFVAAYATKETHVEKLFTAEQMLRESALEYAAAKSNENRRVLRCSALAYAEAACDADEAIETLRAMRTTEKGTTS